MDCIPKHPNKENKQILSVLLISGLFGLFFGLNCATWQTCIEQAQMLIGIIKYPQYNPHYLSVAHMFNILTHFSIILLRIFDSEAITSIVLSSFTGMVSFQAISALIYSINKDAALSILGCLYVYLTSYTGVGIKYGIHMLGVSNAQGVLGLSFIVLVFALLINRSFRIGMFLLGLAPCVHVSYAMWLYLILLLTSIFQIRPVIKNIRDNIAYFVVGFSISIASFVYWFYIVKNLPTISYDMKKVFFDAMVKYWDLHRTPFFTDLKGEHLRIFQSGVALCIFSILVGFIGIKKFGKYHSLIFMSRAFIVSGVLSLVLGAFTHMPPESIPMFFIKLMPGRFVNFNNITLGALVFGILTISIGNSYKLHYLALLIFLIGGFLSHHLMIVLIYPVLIAIFILSIKFSYDGGIFTKKSNLIYKTAILCSILLFMLVNIGKEDFIKNKIFNSYDFSNRANDRFYSEVSNRKGLIVITNASRHIDLKTRRPILINPEAIDGITYFPALGGIMNNITKKVYGIDLMSPLPGQATHNGSISEAAHKRLWEERGLGEWQDIREEFGVTDVLVRPDWKVRLPLVIKNEKASLYEIPERVKGII